MSRTLLGEKKYAKQTGGRGQYGHVRLRVILDDGVQGAVFTNALVGEAIPARFVPAIESGILTSIKGGALEQCGYSDARIELYDGSWHDADSTDLAFFIAGAGALQDALQQLPRRREEPEDREDGTAGVVMPRVPRPLLPTNAASVAEPDDQQSMMDVSAQPLAQFDCQVADSKEARQRDHVWQADLGHCRRLTPRD